MDSEFEVHLDLYEGPLTLLLYLIERDNLNIFDIPIAHITEEYLRHIDSLRADGEYLGGEFLVMATTLMQIKARLLLPRPVEEGVQIDPREELVSKLLLAQRFAKVAKLFGDRLQIMERYAFRPPPVFENEEYTVAQRPADLAQAFRKAYDEFKLVHGDAYAIAADPFPVEAKIEKIMSLLAGKNAVAIADIWRDETARGGLVACFLAILELIKRGSVRAAQKTPYGEIFLVKVLLS
ncbi:MAG: segregation/condensation protein A [Elusimicrobia bacterium]|nr:segregation/condensation protein A [Elusimicrobiota bacterium]